MRYVSIQAGQQSHRIRANAAVPIDHAVISRSSCVYGESFYYEGQTLTNTSAESETTYKSLRYCNLCFLDIR